LGEGFRVRAKANGVARVFSIFTKTVRSIEVLSFKLRVEF
jgi:hypothetical protein